MSEIGAELRPYGADEFNEQLIKGAHAIDMTLIVHPHRDGEHARETAEHIVPHSIVFLEGTMASADIYKSQMMFGTMRLLLGKEHPAYLEAKQGYLELLRAQMYAPAKSSIDFALHGVLLRMALIEKDCAIFPADFYMPDVEEGGDEYKRQAAENAGQAVAESQLILPVPIGDEASVARSIRFASEEVNKLAHVDDMREKCAISIALTTVGAYAHATKDMAVSENGRLTTYLKYGTAHRDSLLAKLRQHNVMPKVIEAVRLPEYRYIDESLEEFGRNRSRRIGHALLASLVHTFFDDMEAIDTVLQEAYASMGSLNDDPDAALVFVVRAVQASHAVATSPHDAWSQTASLLRDTTGRPVV